MTPAAGDAVGGWVRLFRDVGFPALVAAFVLFRLDAAVRGVEVRVAEVVRLLELERRDRCGVVGGVGGELEVGAASRGGSSGGAAAR